MSTVKIKYRYHRVLCVLSSK